MFTPEANSAVVENRRRSSREKTVVVVHNVVNADIPVADLIVPNGGGSKIGDLPSVCRRLNAAKTNSTVLKDSFSAMYPGQAYTLDRVKSAIKCFNGTDRFGEDSVSQPLKGLDMKALRGLAHLFGIPKTNGKFVLHDRILEFLKNPEERAENAKSSKPNNSRKRKSTVEQGSKIVGAPKSVGGYWYYCRYSQAALVEEMPTANVLSLPPLPPPPPA